MKKMTKSFLVLSATLMSLIGAGLNVSQVVANAETAEESGYTWKAVDKFTAGMKYVLVYNSGSTYKAFNGSSNKHISSTVATSDNLTELVNYTFETCAFTAEAAGTTGNVYLKNTKGKYFGLEYYYNDGYYYRNDTSGVTSFKYNTGKYLEFFAYTDNDRNWDTSIKTGNYKLSFDGSNYPVVGTGKSSILIYEQQAEAAEKYYDVTLTGGEGATGDAVSATVKEGELYELPENTFTKTGFKFVCWTDGENDYNPGDEVLVNGELNLTAKWEALASYTIRFLDLEDNDLGKGFTVLEGESKYLYVSYAKEGFSFMGWSTEKDDTVEYENSKYYVFTSDLDLYPVLKPIMDTVKPSASIRTGKDAGLRFKYTISKEQINNTFGYNYDLASYEYGLAVVKTSSLLEVNSYGYLRSMLMNNNVTDQSVNKEKWSVTMRDEWTGTYSTLNIRNIKATNKEFKDDAVTFAGVISGFNDLPETTVQELEAKKELYNAEFTVVAYVALNDNTFKYAAQAKFSYMNAVDEYLANASVYNLSSAQVEELTEIRESYGL